MPVTSRLAIPYPAGSDPVDVPGDIQAVADVLDDAALADQGLLAARPAAAIMGRLYRATDNGKVYWDTGSTWVAASAATGTADLDTSAVTTAKLADAAVTSAKLKPTVAFVAATSDLNLTTTAQDVTGATTTLTLATNSVVLATAVFDFNVSLSGGGEFIACEGYISLGGVDNVNPARWNQISLGGEGTRSNLRGTVVTQAATTPTAGSYTVKLRAKLGSSFFGNQPVCRSAGTTLLVWVISQ